MKITSRISTQTNLLGIIQDLTHGIEETYDLGFLFISFFDKSSTIQLTSKLKTILKTKYLLGCSCCGIIGTNSEIEREPACSLILVKLEDIKIQPFYLDQGRLDALATPEAWYDFLNVYPNDKPNFFILPDPFLIDMNQLLGSLNKAFPNCPAIGGLASGASQSKENILILNDQYYDEGIVGVCLIGHIRIETIVSQGCRPIGETYIVTKAEGNIIYELAGRPLYQVLENVLRNTSQRDRLLAQEAIFVGIAMNEYKDQYKRGDFLIRMLMGLDVESGAGAIADFIKTGQTIQFHVRDAISSAEDLNELLKSQRNKAPQMMPQGAIVFSCNGRGENLFRSKNHDIKIIHNYVGQIPVAGFFCAGEIGPVGGKNFIHGFTSSIALFYSD